jgi:hypothetical protein
LLNGGSGNRGNCEIFCRDLYRTEHQNGSLLYVKDLNCSAYGDKLQNIGISSLKLEGRRRNPLVIEKLVDEMRLGNHSAQTGFIYGTNFKENNLFAHHHNRLIRDGHYRSFDPNKQNISMETTVCNDTISEILLIDDNGNWHKLSDVSNCNYVDFDLNHIDRILPDGMNLYKMQISNKPGLKISEKLLDSAKTLLSKISDKKHKCKNFNTSLNKIYVESDDFSLLKKIQNDDFVIPIYNIASVKNLSFGELKQNGLYKLPLLNFSSGPMSDLYERFHGKNVMCTRMSQIQAIGMFDPAVISTDYNIGIWNKNTQQNLCDMGVQLFTASPELSIYQNRDILGTNETQYILGGNLPLIYTRMCYKHLFNCANCGKCKSKPKPIANIDKNMIFNVNCYDDYRIITNANPVLNNYPALCPNESLRYIATNHSLKDITETIKILKQPEYYNKLKQMDLWKNSYICNVFNDRQ